MVVKVIVIISVSGHANWRVLRSTAILLVPYIPAGLQWERCLVCNEDITVLEKKTLDEMLDKPTTSI